MKKYELISILQNTEKLSAESFVYIDASIKNFSERTSCLILSEDEDAEAADEGERVSMEGRVYRYFLTVSTVQEVMANALSQRAVLSDCQIMRALNFYVEHDAFWPIAP